MEAYHIYLQMRKTEFYHNDEILLRKISQSSQQPNHDMYNGNQKNDIKSSKYLCNEMDYLKENQHRYYKNLRLLLEQFSP